MTQPLTIHDNAGNPIPLTAIPEALPAIQETSKEDMELLEWLETQELVPLLSIVVIRPINRDRTKGGILLPAKVANQLREYSVGEVMAVGPGDRDMQGRNMPINVSKGDWVLYTSNHDSLIEWGGEVLELSFQPHLLVKVPKRARTKAKEAVYEENPCRPPALKCGAGVCRGQATLDTRRGANEELTYTCICGWKVAAQSYFGKHSYVPIPGDEQTERCGRCGGARPVKT